MKAKAKQVAARIRSACTPARVTLGGATLVGLFLLQRAARRRADGKHAIQG